jgi:hypothetical protein
MLRGAPLLPQTDSQDIKLRIEPGLGTWEKTAYVTPREGASSTGILLLYLDREAFLDALAEGQKAEVFVSGFLVGTIPLAGSADGVSRFRDCMDRVYRVESRVRGRRTF